MARDYYAILGVPRHASVEEIKKAWRRLAMRYHPDRRPDDLDAERRFREALEAWRVLSNPEERRRYDLLGPLYRPDGRPPTPEELREILGRTLGGFLRRSARPRGADDHAEVALTLEDLAADTGPLVVFRRQAPCATCDGEGAPPGDGRRPCADCRGTGRARGRRLLGGACPRCDGRGWVRVRACPACGGSGRTTVEDRIRLHVPPGTAAGQELRVAGRGDHPGRGGMPGDLRVRIAFAPHPILHREGADLSADLPLSLAEAALGTSVEVPTLEGPVRIQVPPGTPAGTVVRLAGRGLPLPLGGDARGDLLLRVVVEVPVDLDPGQRRAVEGLGRLLGPRNHPRRRAFDAGLRDDDPPER